jgi:YMGG-like Gly-zipper
VLAAAAQATTYCSQGNAGGASANLNHAALLLAGVPTIAGGATAAQIAAADASQAPAADTTLPTVVSMGPAPTVSTLPTGTPAAAAEPPSMLVEVAVALSGAAAGAAIGDHFDKSKNSRNGMLIGAGVGLAAGVLLDVFLRKGSAS